MNSFSRIQRQVKQESVCAKSPNSLSNSSKKNLPIRTELKNKLVAWSLSSNFHCYPKIFQYENIYAKIIWIIFFILFAFMTFWLVIKGVLDFLEFDVVSKIGVYSEDKSVFPTVTICEANAFTTKEAEYLLSEEKILDENFLFSKGLGSNQTNKIKFIRTQIDFLVNSAIDKTFRMNAAQKQSLGFSLNKTLQSCYFNRQLCDSKDFVWFYSYLWGNCFQFGRGGSKEVLISGRRYGLELFIGPLSNENKYPTYFGHGLRVFIHNSSLLTSSAEEIFVKTGEQTSISIKKTITLKAPSPYSECKDLSDFTSVFYNTMKLANGEYSQKDCFDVCLQSIIIENCKCFMTILPDYTGNNLPCSNSSQTECTYSYSQRNKDFVADKCSKDCPVECNHVTYDFTLSSIDYPSEQFFYTLKNESGKKYADTSFEAYRQTHLSLSIFYAHLEYIEISEIPKITLIDSISSLGGSLGIFLGLSIFSFIEIFEILFQIVFAYVLQKKNSN